MKKFITIQYSEMEVFPQLTINISWVAPKYKNRGVAYHVEMLDYMWNKTIKVKFTTGQSVEECATILTAAIGRTRFVNDELKGIYQLAMGNIVRDLWAGWPL